MPNGVADEILFRDAMDGDEDALVELVNRYHRPVYHYLMRCTGDPALAEDMAQDTFIRLMRYRGEPPTRFKAWLYTIASNRLRDHFRSAQARHERTADGDDMAQIAAGDALPEFAGDEVLDALARLTPEHREVILLRFYHDLKLDEIAEVTRAPLGTVKSRLFHALKGLKAFLVHMEVACDRP